MIDYRHYCTYCHKKYDWTCVNAKHRFLFSNENFWYLQIYNSNHILNMIGYDNGHPYICNVENQNNSIMIEPFEVNMAEKMIIKYNKLKMFI